MLKQRQAKFKAEMEALEQQEQALRQELYGPSDQSEPTTPPDKWEKDGFPSALSRPNRYSSSSMMSQQGLTTRSSRAGSQVTSPPNERERALQSLIGFPSQSMPGSRQDSDGEENDQYNGEVLSLDHRKAAT